MNVATSRPLLHRRAGLAPAILALVVASSAATTAHAGPREHMREAYAAALDQFNNLDYPAAQASIESGIEKAEAEGAGDDPTLASLYVLRAALLYSNEGDAAEARILEAMKRAAQLNYHVVVPIEVRSDGLQKYLDQARLGVSGPAEQITHTPPGPACGGTLRFEALLGVPDGGQAAFYWRKVGDAEFSAGDAMDTFSNVASFELGADEHQDADIEYLIVAFDSNNKSVATDGTVEDPKLLAQRCGEVEGPSGDGDVGPGDGDTSGDGDTGPKEPDGPTSLPRVWINLGLGTGFGLARGTVENTRWQFRPVAPAFVYGEAEHACAIARWVSGGDQLRDPEDLYGDGDPATPLDPNNPSPMSAFAVYGPAGMAGDLARAYDPTRCDERHPVAAGMASAPFHIAPEVAFRVGRRISIGLFTRLQVVTGMNVVESRPQDEGKPFGDPNVQQAGTAYWDDAYSPDPVGTKIKGKFTWAIGARFKYFLGKENAKLRPYVGGFAGYGQTRLRVNLGFGQDRNGNSVPDDEEVAADAIDAMGTNCVPVWPYNNACSDAPGQGDNQIAGAVQTNADGRRVDTVAIGPGFVGALVGMNVQLHKHVGLFADLQIGGWFPSTGSVLFDLNFGPAITF